MSKKKQGNMKKSTILLTFNMFLQAIQFDYLESRNAKKSSE